MEGSPKPPVPQELRTEERELSDEVLSKIATVLSMSSTERDRDWKLKRYAQEHTMLPEKLLREVNAFKVSKIREREKGEVRHFHRTSLDGLVSIIKIGRLLSRSKLKELDSDIQLPGWSSSDNAMMTRDAFNSDGDLISQGFGENEVVGASGKGAILVFSDSVMQNETYDTTRFYPSVADLPIQEHCEVILVDSEQDREFVERLLSDYNFDIPVGIKSTWER